ncbi:MAG TPA: hypothetical protein VKT80_14700, partial [Chloroflexota bacterium]|nr:hypothetical protein [Chloroflexota bacterium]
LLVEVPEFRPAYKEHLRFNGELNGDVLMFDLWRFALVNANAGGSASLNLLRRLFRVIERAVGSPDEITSTTAVVSFLNMIHPDDCHFLDVVTLMGPLSRGEWETYMGRSLPDTAG